MPEGAFLASVLIDYSLIYRYSQLGPVNPLIYAQMYKKPLGTVAPLSKTQCLY